MPQFDITIAGELNLDILLYGLPTELPPERELLATDMMITLGGSSAIWPTIWRRSATAWDLFRGSETTPWLRLHSIV